MLAALFLLCGLAAVSAQPAVSEDSATPAQHGGVHAGASSDTKQGLPADRTTGHVVELPGRTLHFSATAGSITLSDAKGAPEAEITFVAYRLDGSDPAHRPVTFALNGGPGFASAWLDLGAMGPWRIRMDGAAAAPSAPPDLLPNAETWLDFTDLVFIDPAGTGYSRFLADGQEVRKRYWSVNGDIDSLSQVIRIWLQKNQRLASPKYIAGESYAGFRAPRLARALAQQQGIGVNGLMLVSPALDLQARNMAYDPMWWVGHLPSMVAAVRAEKGPVSRVSLADVERYAITDYLRDLLAGPRDQAAVARLVERVSELTGLDPELVRRHAGRIGTGTFLRELHRAQHRVASPYDATVTTADPFPDEPYGRYADPVLDALRAPLTSAMLEVYDRRLDWHPDGEYRLGNAQANRQWDWGKGRGGPEALSALRSALALDPRFRVVVAQGLTDLVVPYFSTQLLLDQLPDFGPGRLRMIVNPGGHMFYTRDTSRAALRNAARDLIQGVEAGGAEAN
jgi:carboxypeptidase C (cathepsin A)